MLVDANDGAIDRGIFIVRIVGQMLEHPLPDTGFASARMARVDDPEIPEPLRQIPTRYRVYHRLHKQPVVLRGHSHGVFTSWQQMLDLCLLIVSQLIAPHHVEATGRASTW